MTTDELRDILHSRYPAMDVMAIRQEDLVFEERVRLKCFHCRNYHAKWTCPGHLPQLDYRKLIGEYEHLAVVSRSAMGLYRVPFGDTKATHASAFPKTNLAIAFGDPVKLEDEYREAGNELHRAMLFLESELMKRNNPLAQSFIGGSCELCEGGCPPNKCAHPEQARVPWDAIGCNVMRSLENIGVQVDFTGKDVCRYGLIAW
ncbi:MAG: hypothetical protein IJT12_02130 [Paludibacteraceae bacterium]|nr:hypothetical protein [Paludibacteraceae bacterium]